jgi:cytoskeleton protein RodZ
MADSEKGSAPADRPQAPQSVGQLLKQARVAQDLSVEQIAAELRIEAKQLAALEEDRFDRIGVPVFVKGYIKQYGTRLGLDPRDLLAAYYQQGKLEELDIRPSRAIKLRDEQQVRGWVVALLVLLAIVIGVAVWWLNGAGFGGIVSPVERAEPAAATPPSAGGSLAGSPRASDRPEGAADGASTEPTQETPSAPSVAPSQGTPGAEAGSAPQAASAVDRGGAGAATSISAGPTPALAASSAAGAVTPTAGGQAAAPPLRPLEFASDLDLTFDQESWVEITDARGERLFYGMGAAGRRAQLRGEPPFTVVIGNVDAVRLRVDGADYEIPRPRQGNFARFTLQVDDE